MQHATQSRLEHRLKARRGSHGSILAQIGLRRGVPGLGWLTLGCPLARILLSLLLESTLELYETRLGADHPDTLTSRSNLANAYLAVGRPADAVALHEATLRRKVPKLGADHPNTLMTLNNLAVAYWKLSDWPKVIEQLKEVLSINPGNAAAKNYLSGAGH